MGYFKAYRNRIQRNSNQLLDLSDKLTAMGYRVEYYISSGIVNGITIYDNKDKGVRLQFNEVPYRWSLEYDINPNNGRGSGITGEELYNDNEIPFSVQDLIDNFKDMYIDKRFSKFVHVHTGKEKQGDPLIKER